MTRSLYEQDPTHWDRIAASGYPNLAEMAKHFEAMREMDVIFGGKGTVSHWHTGRNNASQSSDTIARLWLDLQKSKITETPEQDEGGDLFMVMIPAGKVGKVRKALAFLGCEVVE